MLNFKKIIVKYQYDKSDSAEIAIAKSLILIIASMCCFFGLIWAFVYYSIFGFGLTSFLPLVFVGLVAPSIFLSHYLANYKILVHMQLICITWVPCFIQWSLGSIHDSGFVIAWSFLGPLGAILFLEKIHAIIWLILFILIIGISVIIVPTFSWDALLVDNNVRIMFYLMNIITPFSVIFIATQNFISGLAEQRKKNILLLKLTKEKNVKIQNSLNKEKELGELKSSFVSTASHQFRTPLASIQANSELLQLLFKSLEGKDVKQFNKVTSRITAEISKMTELMDDVLLLGKSTSRSYIVQPQEIDLVDFCKQLVKRFNFMQADGRSINFLTDGEPYSVSLDTKLLSQALSNLLSNAFKFSLTKENPKLIASFKPKEFVLSVKDYGMGIPKKELKKLFQPFFRANNAIDIKGTGLGLSIAKEHVEINNGQIRATSILGEGSCFEIIFKR